MRPPQRMKVSSSILKIKTKTNSLVKMRRELKINLLEVCLVVFQELSVQRSAKKENLK